MELEIAGAGGDPLGQAGGAVQGAGALVRMGCRPQGEVADEDAVTGVPGRLPLLRVGTPLRLQLAQGMPSYHG